MTQVRGQGGLKLWASLVPGPSLTFRSCDFMYTYLSLLRTFLLPLWRCRDQQSDTMAFPLPSGKGGQQKGWIAFQILQCLSPSVLLSPLVWGSAH